MAVKIKRVEAREILDSRGNPTVEAEVILDNDLRAKASVASGASTGEFEALELRDGDEKRFGGDGVLKACSNIREKISIALIGLDVSDQRKIDEIMLELDGTKNKSNLGANAILGTSLSCARAAALSEGESLHGYIQKVYGFEKKSFMPVPMFNILNGGKHADSGLAVQEFMIVPLGIEKFSERLRCGSEIFHSFKKIVSNKNYSTGVGDEGGFSPRLNSLEEGLDLIMQAIKDAGYVPGEGVFISLDVAANSFYLQSENKYVITPGNICLDSGQLVSLYAEWLKRYPIFSIEDCLNENDWETWGIAKERLLRDKEDLVLIADDLTVTNLERLEKASKDNCANGIIIKLNQIGTLSETIDCVKKAQELDWKVIVSHRSGETCDDFIADLSFAIGADFIKSGSLSRGERLAKYNRLMEIEEEL